MAVAVRSGVVHQYRNIELADLIVERPEFLRAEISVLEPTHELHGPETKGFNRSIDLAEDRIPVGIPKANSFELEKLTAQLDIRADRITQRHVLNSLLAVPRQNEIDE